MTEADGIADITVPNTMRNSLSPHTLSAPHTSKGNTTSLKAATAYSLALPNISRRLPVAISEPVMRRDIGVVSELR